MATALELTTVSLEATHVATKEMIEFRCPFNPATDTIGGILNFDETKWTFDTFDVGLQGQCKKVLDGSEGLVGFIIAIVQGIVLMLVGPAIAMYGLTFPRTTSFVQAVIVSSYVLLISSVVSIDAFSAFTVFERCVSLVISTLTVTYATMNSHGAKAKAYGFALGSLIMTPLVLFLAELLYKHALDCDTFGKKNEYFPNGVPSAKNGIDCKHSSAGFQVVFQLTQAVKWTVIFLCAYHGAKLIKFSISVSGSTMLVKGGVDLIKAIGYQFFPDDALAWLTILTPIRAWGTYGVAVLFFLIQTKVVMTDEPKKPEKEGDPPPPPTYSRIEPQPKVCGIMGPILFLCYKWDAFLLRNLSTLKDGGKGALTKSMVGLTSKSKPKKDKKDTNVELATAKDTDAESTAKKSTESTASDVEAPAAKAPGPAAAAPAPAAAAPAPAAAKKDPEAELKA